jgi:hypothetical protein
VKIMSKKEELAYLTDKEVERLFETHPNECGKCEWIINKGLFKTDDGWWITTEQLDNDEIIHIEQIIKHKL